MQEELSTGQNKSLIETAIKRQIQKSKDFSKDICVKQVTYGFGPRFLGFRGIG